MKSSKAISNTTALAQQYNDLREDAQGGSFLYPHEQSSPNMTLKIEDGTFYLNGTRLLFAGGNTPTFTAPTTHPRIDLITIDSAGAIAITAGAENASPVAPTYPVDGTIVICEVYHRVGETSIKTLDDSTNGYVYNDVRPILISVNPLKSRVRGVANARITTGRAGFFEPLNFDTEDFDDNNEFDFFNISGTNTSTATNKLINSGANFTSAYLNRIVLNIATGFFARITNIDSATQVTLSSIIDGANIFPSSSVGYTIFGNRFTCKVAGYYRIVAQVRVSGATDQHYLQLCISKNGITPSSSVYTQIQYASGSNSPQVNLNELLKLAVNDTIEIFVASQDAQLVETPYTTFSIALESI